MKNPMLNEDFLLELEKDRNREVYARIILLDVNELPIEEIEGKVVSGSVNIDGTSVVRRTCSLQLVSNNVNVHDFYWGVKNKFKLEVGLLNVIDNEYPDIIWFKQGIYVITAFSAVLGVNNYTISISGKDKMCLLNGDMAGQIMNISEDFGVKWIWKNDEHTEYIAEDIEIKEIIYKGVQTYAGELPQNIIINDIAECGVQLMEYRGKQPLYLIKNNNDKIYENMTVNGEMSCWYRDTKTNEIIATTLSAIPQYETEISSEINQDPNRQPTIVYLNDPAIGSSEAYTIYKVIGGTGAIGYRLTNLTYAGELMAQAGDAFTSILDKIVDMLGNFEYFYDLDGHFVFQKKKNYITSKWTGLTGSSTDEENITYAEDNTSNDTFSYIFDDNYFITNFSSQPALANMRNDFSAWGVRTSATGAEIPVHMRMAIDHKPWYYKSFDGKVYVSNTKDVENGVDWREIIYQMALDYYHNNSKDDFYVKLRENNIVEIDGEKVQLYPDGRTGYERYYTDMEAFWRQLYIPSGENKAFNNGIIPNDDKDVKSRKNKYYIWDKEKNTCITYSFLDAVEVKSPKPDKKYKVGIKEYLGYNPETAYYFNKNEKLRLSEYDKTKPVFEIQEMNGETIISPPSNYYSEDKTFNWNETISTDNKNYCKLVPGKLIKTTTIGKRSFYYDENNQVYKVGILIEDIRGSYPGAIYSFAKIDEQTNKLTALENGIISDNIVSLVNKNHDTITIGAFLAEGKQLTEGQGKDLIESDELPLQSSDGALTPIINNDTNEYYYWQIDTNNIKCYDSYSFLKAFSVGSSVDGEEWTYTKTTNVDNEEKNYLVNEMAIGTDYSIFRKYPSTKNDEIAIQKLKDIQKDTKITTGNYKLYINNNNYLEQKDIIEHFNTSGTTLTCEVMNENNEWETMYIYTYLYSGENYIYYNNEVSNIDDPWNPIIATNPETLNFWIDFIDPTACGLEKYSVRQIGPRPKVVNENSVKAIYYREVPNILFEENRVSEFSHQPGYTYVYLNDALKNLFVMSGQGISAKDKIEELLNNYTFMAEGVQISGVPIYRLDANTRISVKDIETGISGEYIISRISVPLGHNGTMSITASKAIELIY